jgi:O-antigen/teichoic acid export membrane protein
MLTVIPVVQSGVVFASVGWALAHGDCDAARDHLLEGSRFALIIIAPACVILGVDAAPLLSLLFSEQYVDGAPFLLLQLVGFAAYALADTYSHALMATGQHAIVARIFLALVPASILATFVLLRAAGPVGAAASLALIMIVGATWVGAVTLRRFGALIPAGTVARVTLAIVPIAVAGLALEVTGAWLLLKMLVLGGLYLLLLWLLGEISPSDFQISRIGPNPDASSGTEGDPAP